MNVHVDAGGTATASHSMETLESCFLRSLSLIFLVAARYVSQVKDLVVVTRSLVPDHLSCSLSVSDEELPPSPIDPLDADSVAVESVQEGRDRVDGGLHFSGSPRS